MPKYRIRINVQGMFSKGKIKIEEFDAADDNAAIEKYNKEVQSCREFNDLEPGFDEVLGLERVDVSEQLTKLK